MISVVLACALALQSDSLPLRHAVTGRSVPLQSLGLGTLDIGRGFTYAGGQRFVLRGVADAEQHLFVSLDAARRVQRFYWVQIESYLPSSRGSYDYGADSAVVHNELEWRVQARRWNAAPDPTSDRGALASLAQRAGLSLPWPALRVRWIHLTSPDRRSELMIIYGETTESPAPPTAAEARGAIERARAGFRLVKARR